nr:MULTISPECIES: pectate lyase [Neorhizobium]
MRINDQARDRNESRYSSTHYLIVGILIGGGCMGLPWKALARDAPGAHEPLSPKLPDGRQRAFPTAEGFGAGALGGRGGRAIYVINTNEAGQGSLRDCIEASGPRTCIFRTGGTILLQERSLVIRNPYLTIAGETAPGGGIAIRNGVKQIRPSMEILTNDVIVRYVRFRPGPHAVEACCSGGLGMYTKAAKNIMLDHISASWGSDETIDSEDATDFTWQWGIASEPLLQGGPGKRNRARNMLFTKGGNITVHHSLFAFGKFRNPQIKMETRGAIADIVNNVFFSPVWQYVVSFGDEWTRIQANIVGNYKIGRAKGKEAYTVHVFEESGAGFSIYVKDNYDEPHRTTDGQNDGLILAENHRRFISTVPFSAPPIRTSVPMLAYDDVLQNAGATIPQRDVVDQRIVEQVRNRSGQLIKTDPREVGGWPDLAAGIPYDDRDMDGISDKWELENLLDPADTEDGQQDMDDDGWTNLEEFLHYMARDLR